MRLPDFEGWAVFARVAELGSFAAAARELGVSTATVSKAVARLECRVGAALLSRTSRRVALTAFGRELAGEAARLLGESEALESSAASAATAPQGMVRIAAPMSFGVGYVAPLLPALMTLHPGVSVELSLSDEVVDLIGGGFDAALRISMLADSTLRVRRICSMRLLVVAAPAWVERHGMPAAPEEIPLGALFGYAYAPTPSRVALRHVATGAEAMLPTGTRLRTNNGEAMLPALIAGIGIGVLPEFAVWEALRAGSLVRLLEDWRVADVTLNVVMPPGARRPARVTACVEFLVSRLAAEPWAMGAGESALRE